MSSKKKGEIIGSHICSPNLFSLFLSLLFTSSLHIEEATRTLTMLHSAFNFTVTNSARRAVRRLVSTPCRHTSSLRVLLHSTRAYTAIPLSQMFVRRGALPHLARNSSAAQLTPPALHADTAVRAATSGSSSEASSLHTSQQSSSPPPSQRPYGFLQCRTTSQAPALVYAASAAAAELRVCESVRPASRMACVRVPRLLVFGGDVVSVTALEALHARMRCIVAEALHCSRLSTSRGMTYHSCGASSPHKDTADGKIGKRDAQQEAAEEAAEVDAFVREHITVVCPALPKGMTPEEAARRFTRQYPVARYCVDNGLPIIPVDHPKSLAKSALLKEMLSTVQAGAAASSASSTTATEGASSARAHRQHKAATFTSHLPSHVFSASHLLRSRSPTQIANAGQKNSVSNPKVDGEARQTAVEAGSGVARDPATHTWAAQGRSLDDYDLVVVVSFRYFLPQHLLRVLPPVINMHPSLLLRYRGASPIFSALRHNETLGGVSIIQMKPEQKAMDSGSILWQCEVPITPDMDIRLYFPLVTQIGAAGLCDLIFGEAPASASANAAATAASAPSAAVRVGAAAAAAAMAVHQRFEEHADTSASSQAQPEGEAVTPTTSHETTTKSKRRLEGAAPRAANGSADASIPPWVALRRSSLMPVVHRSAGHADRPTPLHDRERLAPYVDRLELSIFSSIITAQSSEADRAKKAGDSTCDDESKSDTVPDSSRDICCGDSDAASRQSHHWMTLCRNSTHITPEAVHEASKAHRALFFQNLGSASASSCAAASHTGKRKNVPPNKKQVSPAAAAALEISTAMKCAEVFPKSVLSPHCDWPDSFTYSWKFAQVQEYRSFAHFTDDPCHAPLLPKDAAVLHFSAFTAMEAFGVWRAYVGGDYFQPSVNATLDKGGSPVRNQLVHRGVRRLLRERSKPQKGSKSPATAAPPSSEPSSATGDREAAAVAAVATACADNETPIGIVVGKHVELDVFNPAGLQLLTEAENMLRIPCTFTQVTNPTLVPSCVQAELAEVERGGDRCCGYRPAAPLSGRRVRFYRAPPAIFRSLLSTRGTAHDNAEEGKKEEGSTLRRMAARRERGGSRGCGANASAADEGADKKEEAAKMGKKHRGVKAATQQPDEPAEDEEAPEDYVPDVIHAAPPTEHRWHIPPGTGYFPESDESYGAIKCKDGWFLWKEAHMNRANKAQPAVLIRKGLAMKTGVLYVGLFSEYS